MSMNTLKHETTNHVTSQCQITVYTAVAKGNCNYSCKALAFTARERSGARGAPALRSAIGHIARYIVYIALDVTTSYDKTRHT